MITISDVVREADINRGTFYNHYNNLSDVINEIEDELMDELTKTMNISMKENNSLVNFIYTITNHLKANEASYKTICAYIPKYIMDDMKKKFFLKLPICLIKKMKSPLFLFLFH